MVFNPESVILEDWKKYIKESKCQILWRLYLWEKVKQKEKWVLGDVEDG